MCGFYIIGQKRPMRIKVRNKITGRIKEYKANYVVAGTFFLRFDNIFLPKLIYEKIEMCDFCENIHALDYKNSDYKNCIHKNENGVFIHFTTGDSFMDFDYKINYCPICGRKLVE